MKKVILLLIILVSGSYSFGQSLQIVSGNTVLWCDNDSSCDAPFTVKNISGNSNNYKCYRTVIYKSIGDTNYFCWGINCYPPTKDTSTTAVTIAAGDSNASFHGWLTNAVGTTDDSVEYCIYNVNNLSDMTCFTVIYHFRPTGIDEISQSNNLVSFYPNPNDGNFKLNYNLNNKSQTSFKIVDVTGRLVYEKNDLSMNQNTQNISLPDLNNGIYYWMITSDKGISEKGKFSIIK